MGEYVHASITIRGHIPSVEAFNDLLDALESKELGEMFTKTSRDDLIEMFAEALVKGESPYFESGDVNYGNLDEVTSVCQGYDIAYERTSEAAGDSGPEDCCWYPGEPKEFAERDSAIGGSDLAKLLDEPDLRAALEAKVAHLNRAAGRDLPHLSVADELRDHLAVVVARIRVTGKAA